MRIFHILVIVQWQNGAPEKYQEVFRAGDVYISALNVTPKDFVSLFEVYLHVWFSLNGGLPPLNKRIG